MSPVMEPRMHTETTLGYALSIEDFPLRGLLVCATLGCRRKLYPLPPSGRDPRAYRNSCGCRMRPVDASAVEQLVFDTVTNRVPSLDRTEPAGRHQVYRSLLTEVAVGGTLDEVTVVWRT